MQKIGRICLPPKSSDFIVQVEHVQFSTRKSPNFLECRAVIGQCDLHDKPVILDPRSRYVQLHAEIRWPVNFKTNARPAN